METQNPHDKFFKASFSNRKLMLEFMRNMFPKDLLKKLDLRTLKLEKVSFVDEKLEEHFGDLIYSCALKSKLKVRITLLYRVFL